MEGSPIIVNTESADPCLAFDCVNLWDRGMQGFTKLQNAWGEAAAQSNSDVLQLYEQALWFVPGLFFFDNVGQMLAAYVELQISMMSLLAEETKVAARVQADIASIPFGNSAGVLAGAMDVASGAEHQEHPGRLPSSGRTVAAA